MNGKTGESRVSQAERVKAERKVLELAELRYRGGVASSLELLCLQHSLPPEVLMIVANHHERWDGSGYPRGLKGEEIPLAARIFAIVDVWDALISDRPYRKAVPQDEVKQRIKADAGKHFDPHVVRAFLELQDLSA